MCGRPTGQFRCQGLAGQALARLKSVPEPTKVCPTIGGNCAVILAWSLSDVLKRGIPQRTFNPRKVRTMHVGFFGKAFLRPTLRVPQFPKARGEDLFNFPCRFQPTIIDIL